MTEQYVNDLLSTLPFVGLFLGGVISAIAKPVLSVASKALPFLKSNSGSLIQAGGNIVGGLIGAEGQADANSANAQLARENRDWQENMANTAHQREVADLRAAGINPILSAKFGGSATPPGNVAQMNNPMEPIAGGIHSAVATRMQSALNREQILTQRSVQSANSAQAMASRATAIKAIMDAQKVKAEIPGIESTSSRESAGKKWRESKPFEWIKGIGDTLKELNPFFRR